MKAWWKSKLNIDDEGRHHCINRQ